MSDLSTTQLLLIVNTYVLLAVSLLVLSANDLVCWLKQGSRCAKRQRAIKVIVAVPLMLSCLALLAFGLLLMGMSHGSGPKDYEIWLLVLACLTPFFLLIFWIVGSLWVDALWVGIITALFVYLALVNPAIYVRFWANDDYQWAQMWVARHYEMGHGGLIKSEPMARSWYKKAAENGNRQAQYKIALTQRHSKNARKWFLLAAEQGHVGAMVQLARLTSDKDQRRIWINRAVSHRHPEALFMLAEDTAATDLPSARQLLLEAAEKGSRSAIIVLIAEYQQGGIFFDQNDTSANQWLSVLENIPASDTDPKHLGTVAFDQLLKQTQNREKEISTDKPDALYRQARVFLRYPAKDQILHDRAIEYLKRAANKGHSAAAIKLAKLATKNNPANKPDEEAVQWYEIAANNDNRSALKELTEYYKEKPDATLADLEKSLEYNARLLSALQSDDNSSSKRFQQDIWSSEYRDTQKKQAKLKRLGGSWQAAIEKAEDDPQQEYRLAKELLSNRQYEAGMQRMKSAAQRGNLDARYELADRVFTRPHSFMQEVDAFSELQKLDQLGFLPASFRLGSFMYGTRMAPKNLYLARQLFRKAQADANLSEQALRMLEITPDFTDSLQLNPGDNPRQKIKAWYEQSGSKVQDLMLWQQQYKALLDHFSDIDQLKREAAQNDNAKAQYQLAQSLQSHDFAEAMQWLQRAAANGNSSAQYELSMRMIRCKRNPPETQQALKNWAITAANNGHVGAMIFVAAQFRIGYGGFEKNTALAKKYYLQALQSTDADMLFEGKIAGRSIDIKRAYTQKVVNAMSQ